MITKLQMDGVASYKSTATIETDKKVNLVYGLNGTGKSTISNYLYDRDRAEFDKCSVDVGADEDLLVYNQRFIKDHFYEADSLKGIFSLSKENKEVEEKIKAAETELDSLLTTEQSENNFISEEKQRIDDLKNGSCETTWEIRKKYTGGDRVLEFCLENLKGKKETLFDYLAAIPKPETKPSKSIETIKKDVEAIHGDSAQPYDLLPTVEFDAKDVETHNVYREIVVGSSDSPISSLIEKLNNSDWVRQGLNYIGEVEVGESSECPFCQEKTITNNLSLEISNYFDESFNDSIALISNHLSKYENAASNLLALDAYKNNPFAKNRSSELSQKHRDLEKNVSSNLETIKKKVSTPSLSLSLTNTAIALQSFNDLITEINSDISAHNVRFNNVATEIAQLKSEFWDVMRWDYDQTISPWLCEKEKSDKALLEAKVRKDKIEEDVKAKRDKISALQKSTVNIDAAIVSINNGLVNLGITDFSIKKHHDPLYKIVRTETESAEFLSLSEGEKMIISFLYFCELCRGKRSATETKKKRIAIIDDPISSLSHIFVFNIGQMLKTEFFRSDSFEQIFVLTHSLYFFYELTDTNHERRKKTQNLFRLSKNDQGSSISNMKYEEIQNDYHSYWLVVTDPSQPPALIANCMRNIIEYFFNFVQKADFSNVIQMPELQDNRHQAFCRYINRESHSIGQNIFDYKEFNYDDFRDGLRLVFEASGYPEHYKKMTQVLSA
ncbi:AAA family ATPase [Zhongshania sp.]|jgi:wobble nucleotide-excising tRNase|uniref:AAA family ATPase n=1 Tax=Zhongshania sp. TaxID=1971902 RepID=UPI001B3DF48C|nr:AAA family ATPase [Zhongshania sp.]MBQ0796448.1 AAA family ATPase [Zhongshania sp.]